MRGRRSKRHLAVKTDATTVAFHHHFLLTEPKLAHSPVNFQHRYPNLHGVWLASHFAINIIMTKTCSTTKVNSAKWNHHWDGIKRLHKCPQQQDNLCYYLKPLRKMGCKRLERDITQKCIVVEEELEERPTNHIDKTWLTNYKFDVFLSHHFSPSSFTLLSVLTIMAGVLLFLWCSNSSWLEGYYLQGITYSLFCSAAVPAGAEEGEGGREGQRLHACYQYTYQWFGRIDTFLTTGSTPLHTPTYVHTLITISIFYTSHFPLLT